MRELPMHVQGQKEWSTVRKTAKAASKALGIPEDSVLVASTGVIGMQLPMDKITAGIEAMAPLLSVQKRREPMQQRQL